MSSPATLVADDPELELTACSAGVLKVLIDLLQKVHDDKLPQWLDVEFEHVSQFREVVSFPAILSWVLTSHLCRQVYLRWQA